MKHCAARAALAAVALTQVACDGGGLVAFIQLEPGVQASCVSLTVTEPDTGRLLDGRQVARASGQDEYRIAVYRGTTLPGEVVFQAHALSGSNGCAVPVTLVSSSEPQRRAFPAFAGRHPDQVPLLIPFRPVVRASTLDFSTPALTALGGACLGPAGVRAEDQAGNPEVLAADTSVALSADVSGVTFFSDAQCASPISGVLLGPGTPEATFYFRSRAAGAIALRAEAPPLGPGTQVEQIVPNVRAGSCTMNVGTLSRPCAIGAPGVFDPSRAFLVVQAISDDNNPAGVNVRCNLADAGTIDCTRYGGGGTVNVA
ncbi:MAG TPA: hypothetical protein VFB81_21725, partial [Myxococcales bacterium]|nr:hypothetical protein [Myxococcales bacterium]